jgi:hypothetical protein
MGLNYQIQTPYQQLGQDSVLQSAIATGCNPETLT